MHNQRACLVVNPRDGQNLAKLPAILAVFSAAGWYTDVVLKEYGGHAMELATEAARKGYDIVIGYGAPLRTVADDSIAVSPRWEV